MTDVLTELDELMDTSRIQYEYVIARSQLPTIKEALAKVDRSVGWLYALPNKDYLEEIADKLRYDRLKQAEFLIRQAVTGAARVMIEDLQAKDRKLRQAAAKDILDRAGIRAPDKTQVEVIATIAARTLEDVLTQVYGQAPMLPQGDVVDGTIIDNVDDNSM
jgi:hypothetical protein